MKTFLFAILVACGACAAEVRVAPTGTHTKQSPAFYQWAQTPPMGWNSWVAFGASVTEAQVKANADYMAKHLKPFGWEYVVVDIQWYEPNSRGYGCNITKQTTMDEWGRVIPTTAKHPSAANGQGFKPLADYVHKLGLKFGIHIMRGIPRAAVAQNTPILGTKFHAADIADRETLCAWNVDMFGVDMTKPGAQEYYDSLMKLYADWGVDFVKIDDLTSNGHDNAPPSSYHTAEVEGYRKAIDRCGRAMVLSTSPGATPLGQAAHVAANANMWRIKKDFWDTWQELYDMFALLDAWTPYRAAGHWPDGDLLPFGRFVKKNRNTEFTPTEQTTLMTLWCIARSPLIFGGHLPDNDAFTTSLLTNAEVIAVNQQSTGNRQLYRHGNRVAWVADVPGTQDRYLALFNLCSTQTEIYRSAQVTRQKQSVDIAADITGAKKLYLIVEDCGDGYDCDHADWIEPRLTGPNGELKLTKLKWRSATAGWGKAAIGKSVTGKDLIVDGKQYADGIGTHSKSVIEYDLPAGYTKFTARGGLDKAGVTKKLPGATVRFVLATEARGIDVAGGEMTVTLSELGFDGPCRVRDLWAKRDLGDFTGKFGATLPLRGAGLYRLSPLNRTVPE